MEKKIEITIKDSTISVVSNNLANYEVLGLLHHTIEVFSNKQKSEIKRLMKKNPLQIKQQ